MEVKEFRLEPIFLGKGSPPGSYSTAIPPEILTPRPAKEGEGEDDEDDEEETKKKKEREENGRSNNLRTVEEDEEFQLLGMALSAWSDIEMGENFPYSTDKEDEDEEDGERNRNRKEKDSENETSEEEEGDEEDNEREGRKKKGANTKNTPPTYPILKEPPTLPPHLLKAVLNHQMEEDPTVLPLPHHVMLNHLYFKEYDSEDEDMDDACVVGTTYRYRQKFVTTVFYRPATLRPRAAKPSPPTPAAPKEGEATATNATQPSKFQAV
ncbi:galactose metabolism-related protein [Balamuthia mandrillaris]